MKKEKSVTHRPKGNENLPDEPEMKELKRMIKNGELDQDRTIGHA